MQALSISCLNFDYNVRGTHQILRYLHRRHCGGTNSKSQTTSSGLLRLQFKNTAVLYCSSGYDDVDGEYEKVSSGGVDWLVSPHPFLDAKTLRPIRFEPLKLDDAPPQSGPASSDAPPVTVIVPVFGSPRYTLDIRREIEAFLPELKAIGGRVVISIDGHPVPAQNLLHRDLLSGLDADLVDVHCQDRNLGFIDNVNFLYSKTGSGDIVVLLTTDVRMQPGSISRVIAPLLADEKIALSTPFAIGGENLEAPECDVVHWRELDRILSWDEPAYPDAETNVGYMLAVDRRKYPGARLFDDFFVNGYGDDSDLYYRCVNLGYRGVVADNCCVYHEHGASFGVTELRSELRVENHRRFMERWGQVFEARHAAAVAALEKVKTDKSRLLSALVHSCPMPQLVFLLPTNDRRIGGVAAVFDIVEGLCDRGLPAAVICAATPFDEHGLPVRSIPADDAARCDVILANAAYLIATAHDTCEPVKKMARQHGLKSGYFIQGPEFSFSDGEYLASVLSGYAGFDAVFVVSEFLKEIVGDYIDEQAILIPYGPPLEKYYDLGVPREPKSIAVQFNGNPNKGAAYVAGVVSALAPLGYRIYSFGNESLRGRRQNFCTHLGFLSTAEKVRLFNKVEFYLDASNYEGLGLLLMESIRCGVIPLYRYNGGTAHILQSRGVGIEIGDYAAIHRIRQQLTEFRDAADFGAERARCKNAIADRSCEAGVAAMLEWWNAQR
jgi:GT2 family glycosyltransferase